MPSNAPSVPEHFSKEFIMKDTVVMFMGLKFDHTFVTSVEKHLRGQMHCSNIKWCTCHRTHALTTFTARNATKGVAHRFGNLLFIDSNKILTV